MSDKYAQVKAGQWVQPITRGYKMSCCDCRLVHTVDFRVYRGHIQLRAFRDNRATANKRRGKAK